MHWPYPKRFFKTDKQTESNAEGSATKKGVKSQLRSGNNAFCTRSTRSLNRRGAHYKELSCEDYKGRPLLARKKRPVSSKANKESKAESETKLKKAWASIETTGALLVVDDKVPSPLLFGDASKVVLSSSSSQ